MLHGKCIHPTDNCKDVRAMVNKHMQKKKKCDKKLTLWLKQISAVREKTKKRRKTEMELQQIFSKITDF